MKITKDYLKRLIKEQIAAMDDDDDYKEVPKVGDDEVKVGDFLEVLVDGGMHSVRKVTEDDPYVNFRSYMTPFKAKVEIVEIAERAED
jgi:hypothetical protein